MKFSLLMNMKMPTFVAEKSSCSAELSMKKFYNHRDRFIIAYFPGLKEEVESRLREAESRLTRVTTLEETLNESNEEKRRLKSKYFV